MKKLPTNPLAAHLPTSFVIDDTEVEITTTEVCESPKAWWVSQLHDVEPEEESAKDFDS